MKSQNILQSFKFPTPFADFGMNFRKKSVLRQTSALQKNFTSLVKNEINNNVYCPHSFLFHLRGSKTVKQNWEMKQNWVGWNKIEKSGFYGLILLFKVSRIKI